MVTLGREKAASDFKPEDQPRTPSRTIHDSTSWRGRLGYIAVGLASLVWLILRSGTMPGRLAYPCQRVAAANGLGFLAYTASLIASTRLYHRVRKHLTFGRLVLLVAVLFMVVLLQGEVVRHVSVRASPILPAWTSPDANSDVFAVTNVPTPTVSLDGGSIPGGVSPAEALHGDGVDALINLMATHGVNFYRTAQQPEGIIGRDDVVVIKVNNQWNCGTGADRLRSHTNSDVVKGMIYRIVQHPERFTGAVVIADNGQGVPAPFDCADHNNAQDVCQSFQDVADAFVSKGYAVCTYDWSGIRDHFVSEYISGDTESGYVLVEDGTPGVDQLSYPKFEVACGSRTYWISMRYGLWNGVSYDDTKLKLINSAILKRHTAAGATIAVKNYVGFLTTANLDRRFGDSVTMHGFFWGYQTGSDYGLLGRQLALIRRADWNVVDAIWVNPVSNTGSADSAVRDDILLASTDPFAVDYYASAYVLVPHMTPGSDWAHEADARHHGGEFRGLLMTNENQARSKGMDDIIDLDDSFSVNDEQDQFNVFVADASALPDVTLSLNAEPTSRTVQIGQSAAYTLSSVINGGYTRPVTLTLTGVPSETNALLAPKLLIPPATSQLRVTTTASTKTGAFEMIVTSTAGVLVDTAELALVVVPVAPPSFTLSVSPTTRIASPNRTVSYTVVIIEMDGLGQPVDLAVMGLPTGVGVAWSINPVTPISPSILTLSIPGRPPFGGHPFQVVGTTQTLSATKGAKLIIEYPFKEYVPIILKEHRFL
jgi:hypothetical protein